MKVNIVPKKDKNCTYAVSYVPQNRGFHKVKVLHAEKEIPNSPYKVNVQAQSSTPPKATVSGPGIQPEGVVANKVTFFDILRKDIGPGTPEVIVLDPQVVYCFK